MFPSISTGTRMGIPHTPPGPSPMLPTCGSPVRISSAKLRGSAIALDAGESCREIRRMTWPSGVMTSRAYQLGTEGNTRWTIPAKLSISSSSSSVDCDNACSTFSDRLSSTSTAVAARRVASRLRCFASSFWSLTIDTRPSPATSARGRIPASAIVSRRLRNGTERVGFALA